MSKSNLSNGTNKMGKTRQGRTELKAETVFLILSCLSIFLFALSLFVTPGIAGDRKLKLKETRLLAERGNAAAQYDLGKMYVDDGLGVPQNYKEAVKWFRKAAAQGNALAQIRLGLHFGDGNDKESFKWYLKAAEQGNVLAQHLIGEMYDKGNGVPQDYKKAVKWFRKAAEQGSYSSQNSLGVMIAMGNGIPQDYKEAYIWFNLAGAQGDDLAIKNRDNVAEKLDPATLSEAQSLSKEYYKKYVEPFQ